MNEISKAEMAGYLAVMMSWVPRDHQKEQIYRAIYAVIRAALRPKVVSREWFNELTVAIMYHHGTDETQGIIQPVAKGMLREKGIVVEEKP